MSIKLIADELHRFLLSKEPEVVCITGKWGVGKTDARNYYLREAQRKDSIGLEKCSYISLFGRNPLEDVPSSYN